MTRLVDLLVSLAIRFQEWREPPAPSAEDLHAQRIAEQERAITEWLLNHVAAADAEEFCDACLAGLESSEHFYECLEPARREEES